MEETFVQFVSAYLLDGDHESLSRSRRNSIGNKMDLEECVEVVMMEEEDDEDDDDEENKFCECKRNEYEYNLRTRIFLREIQFLL